MLLLLILFFSSVTSYQNRTHDSGCIDPTEISCDNGECIYRHLWCDSIQDCSDGSDEERCCSDGSDEERCYEESALLGIRAPNGKLLPEVGRDMVLAVGKAAKYIVSQATDDGWGQFTPRAIVALSFANVLSILTPDQEKLMMKHLKIHLMRDLLNMTFLRATPSLISLASYINALYATCQDPRNFEGHDLVALLRQQVDAGISSNFSYPYALMSLCLADSIKGPDVSRLTSMYNSNSSHPGFRALVITAMTCIGHTNESIKEQFASFVRHFFDDISSKAADEMDVYSKALYLQAAIASDFSTPSDIARFQLGNYQLPDGSFGDMLATYSLIPVLLHSSLLDLRCELSAKEALITSKEFRHGAEHELVYSLWITTGKETDTHSMIVPFSKNSTFLDIMKTAAIRNPLFEFLYEETHAGKKVYSLAGIPNDAETARKWRLYKGHKEVTIDSRQYLNEVTQTIDKIFPEDKMHFSFWYIQ